MFYVGVDLRDRFRCSYRPRWKTCLARPETDDIDVKLQKQMVQSLQHVLHQHEVESSAADWIHATRNVHSREKIRHEYGVCPVLQHAFDVGQRRVRGTQCGCQGVYEGRPLYSRTNDREGAHKTEENTDAWFRNKVQSQTTSAYVSRETGKFTPWVLCVSRAQTI